MPFISIRMVKEVLSGDPIGKKAEIAAKVVDAITQATGLAATDVSVVFEDVAAADWYVGPTSVADLRAQS